MDKSYEKIEELLLSGSLAIPDILLRFYPKLHINDKQLVILIQILRFKEKERNPFPSVDEIASVMHSERETVKTEMAQLMEQGIITIVNNDGKSEYKLEGLFKNLALELEKNLEEHISDHKEFSTTVQKTYPLFEKEFGRPLSPMETSQLIEWAEGEGYDAELIIEALKRSVLRGARNFRYIDSILRQWSKNGIKTAKEINDFEKKKTEEKSNSEKRKVSNKKTEKKKYKDIYMNWGG